MVRGRAWTGFEAAALQEAMRRSVRDFAGLLGVETTTVNNWRVGLSTVTPRSSTQSILDTTFALRTTPQDRERFEQIVAEGEAAWQRRNRPQQSPLIDRAPSDVECDDRDELLTVLNRLHKLSRSVDPDLIDQMQAGTLRAIGDYETSEPAEFVPWLRKQRVWLESLIDECGEPRQRVRLFEIAGQTSGLLGYIAVGCGSFAVARAYCLEAYQLSRYAADSNLIAWARGMQSFCEYYAGRYGDALRFAEAGFTEAAGGRQSIRLAVNGIARAKGKLGDADGVRRAVDSAYQLQSDTEQPKCVPSSISLDCYNAAQIAGNAATAFLSLAMPIEVERFGRIALAEMTAEQSPWGRALVQVDMARAHVMSDEGDFDAAIGTMRKALDRPGGRFMTPIHARGTEFVHDAAARWGDSPQLREIREVLAEAAGAGRRE
ncbi:hypothetical protein GV794_02415 [Nocardia cyriacigeorgica]|uniref:XRE family transcriptional regulator n=1 Tax=Nocardia cyriacigeorgica TaxID=135487 RepID=A0ABX0CD73_9NOCA|nr:hypothetical protein [Nocardia cyriacigeorgica]NEW54521.1 hypothetical protein [Nocardia cyriacigeorgica]